MPKVRMRDYRDDSLAVGRGMLRGMDWNTDRKGALGMGFWWNGDYLDRHGIVSIYRQSHGGSRNRDYTWLDIARDGRLYMRTWEACWGNETIVRLAKQFMADVISGRAG